MQLLLWFALAIDGVVLLAAIVKWRAVAMASKWPATSGRIVASQAEARRVAKSRIGQNRVESDEVRNFATVTYAFNVGGAKFHGSRIGLGEDAGNAGIAETLKRYPKGADVTVYYDPANPLNCILEREPPSESFFRSVIGTGVAVGAVIVAMLLAANGMVSARSFVWPELRWTPATVLATGMAACAFILISAALRLQGMQCRWRKTSGKTVSAEAASLNALVHWLDPRSYFRARTVYEYVIDGVRYESDRVGFGELDFSSNRHIAKRDADRFEPGAEIDVHYSGFCRAASWRPLAFLVVVWRRGNPALAGDVARRADLMRKAASKQLRTSLSRFGIAVLATVSVSTSAPAQKSRSAPPPFLDRANACFAAGIPAKGRLSPPSKIISLVIRPRNPDTDGDGSFPPDVKARLEPDAPGAVPLTLIVAFEDAETPAAAGSRWGARFTCDPAATDKNRFVCIVADWCSDVGFELRIESRDRISIDVLPDAGPIGALGNPCGSSGQRPINGPTNTIVTYTLNRRPTRVCR